MALLTAVRTRQRTRGDALRPAIHRPATLDGAKLDEDRELLVHPYTGHLTYPSRPPPPRTSRARAQAFTASPPPLLVRQARI